MILEVSDLTKKYGKQTVLNGVDFSLKAGECVGITGGNGCGKTTLLSILAGVEKKDGGFIILNSTVGYLPQTNPLLEDASVFDNISLWSSKREDTDRILKLYDFDKIKRKKVNKLSGGMKRRLAIACAIVNSPGILIMDEPTAALDINYKKLIHDQMNDFVNNGGTILIVTHEKEEILMCQRCYYMENGKLKIREDYNGRRKEG